MKIRIVAFRIMTPVMCSFEILGNHLQDYMPSAPGGHGPDNPITEALKATRNKLCRAKLSHRGDTN